LSSTTWDISGDSLTPLETVTMTDPDRISITNAGTVPIDLGLVITGLPGGWILDDHVAWDTTAVFGRFTAGTTAPLLFDDNDLLAETVTWSDGTILGTGSGVSYCVDGSNNQNLWFKFTVPEYYAGVGDQTISVRLLARTDLP
ncbi:MAG: hypothetical protein ACP5G4_12160, partial [bacterium]